MSSDTKTLRTRDLYITKNPVKGAVLECSTNTGRAEWSTGSIIPANSDHGFRTKEGATLVTDDVVSQVGSAVGPTGIGDNGMAAGSYSRALLNGVAFGNGSATADGAIATFTAGFPTDGSSIAMGNSGTGAGENGPAAEGGGSIAIGSYLNQTRITPNALFGALSNDYCAISVGAGSSAQGGTNAGAVALGTDAQAQSALATSIGVQTSGEGVAIGNGADSGADGNNISIAASSSTTSTRNTLVGFGGALSGLRSAGMGNVISANTDVLCLLGGAASGGAASSTEFDGHAYLGGGGDYRLDISSEGGVYAGYASDSVGTGFYDRQVSAQTTASTPIDPQYVRAGGIVYFNDTYSYTTGDVGNPYTMPTPASVYQEGLKSGHTWTFSTVNLGSTSVGVSPYSATSSVIGLVLPAGWTLYPTNTSLRLNPLCSDMWRVIVRQISPSVLFELQRLTPLSSTPSLWDNTEVRLPDEPEGTLVIDVAASPTVYVTTGAFRTSGPPISVGKLIIIQAPGKAPNWEFATS